MTKEQEIQKEMRKAYKDGYLMAVKQLRDMETLSMELSIDEMAQMMEVSAKSIPS